MAVMTDGMPLPRPIALAEFTPLVGQVFTADCDPEAVPLELVEAAPLINRARLERSPFILIFRSAPDALLVEGHYVLRSRNFGPAQVHIGPVLMPGEHQPGHYYQAVFN